jgi:hypothetical protein
MLGDTLNISQLIEKHGFCRPENFTGCPQTTQGFRMPDHPRVLGLGDTVPVTFDLQSWQARFDQYYPVDARLNRTWNLDYVSATALESDLQAVVKYQIEKWSQLTNRFKFKLVDRLSADEPGVLIAACRLSAQGEHDNRGETLGYDHAARLHTNFICINKATNDKHLSDMSPAVLAHAFYTVAHELGHTLGLNMDFLLGSGGVYDLPDPRGEALKAQLDIVPDGEQCSVMLYAWEIWSSPSRACIPHDAMEPGPMDKALIESIYPTEPALPTMLPDMLMCAIYFMFKVLVLPIFRGLHNGVAPLFSANQAKLVADMMLASLVWFVRANEGLPLIGALFFSAALRTLPSQIQDKPYIKWPTKTYTLYQFFYLAKLASIFRFEVILFQFALTMAYRLFGTMVEMFLDKHTTFSADISSVCGFFTKSRFALQSQLETKEGFVNVLKARLGTSMEMALLEDRECILAQLEDRIHQTFAPEGLEYESLSRDARSQALSSLVLALVETYKPSRSGNLCSLFSERRFTLDLTEISDETFAGCFVSHKAHTI